MKKMAMSQAETIVGGTFKHSTCTNNYEIALGPNFKPTCYSVKTCTDKNGAITKHLNVAAASSCPSN
ncbi:DUF4762 family protein [Ewingella americana]|jgi:hypothetical protein|uniref:DUF4762 family protein n=1 Tax=Ewingella americana TaxID=41202 RepID=UPI000C2FED84|nr:DUF4762 family protein [Ewingella americana]MRT04118.1 DUF4762 domain-containing protein [Ewingella americana]PKB85949.1 hypothetical protein A8A01_31475 [Ewingella americana]